MEMSFATQEDVLDIISRLLFEVFGKFKGKQKSVNNLPFPTFTFKESMEQFGCDKLITSKLFHTLFKCKCWKGKIVNRFLFSFKFTKDFK